LATTAEKLEDANQSINVQSGQEEGLRTL
jgi:hypothetical protein